MKKIILTLFCLIMTVSYANAATINKIAAVVNGEMISVFDVQQAALPEMKKNKLDAKNAAHKAQIEELYNRVLDNMILEILIIGEAEKHKITATDADVDAEISRIMQESGLSKERFEKQLLAEGLSVSTLRTKIHNTIVRQKLMTMMVGRKIVVQPDEVKKYYNEHKNELVNKKDTLLALLVYPDNADIGKYAAQILEDGRKFEEIAKQISIGPNKEGGGHLGPIKTAGMDPRLKQIIDSLKEGEATKVFVLNGKKSQFKLVQKASEGGIMTFEEAKPIIEGILREPLLKDRFEEYIKQIQDRAIIDVRM